MSRGLVHRSPVLRIVAVQVEAANAVFANLTVTVMVNALADHLIFALTLANIFHDTSAPVAWVDDVVALWILVAHPQNLAVAIQVDGRVLVQQAVAVVVGRSDGAPVGLCGMHIEVMPVGIVDGAEVDGIVIDHPGDLRVFAVVVEQVAHEPEDGLGAAHLAAVAVTLEIGGRLIGCLAGFLVGDGHLEDWSPLIAGSYLIEVDQIGILGGKTLHVMIDHLRRMELVEGQPVGRLILDVRIVDFREETNAVAVTSDRIKTAGIGLGESRSFEGADLLCRHHQRGGQQRGQCHRFSSSSDSHNNSGFKVFDLGQM